MMLDVSHLSVGYARGIALHDLSFHLAPGEVLAVIGPNGAGKSTLIRALSGVIPVIQGNVRYQGEDLLTMSEAVRARHIAVVPQAAQTGGAFTVSQTVLLGRTPYMGWLGQPSQKDHEVVQQVLAQTDLLAFEDRRIAELSGGEQQRALLARALAQQAKVLLLDEPTNHLDLRYQSALLSLVRSLADEEGLAVIIALHDLNQVSLIADQVILLNQGKLVKKGRTDEVLQPVILEEVYGASFQTVPHPETGAPVILPRL